MDKEILDASKEDVPFIPSIFTIPNSRAPSNLITCNPDLNNILANQQEDSVLGTVKSWIFKGEVKPKKVEARQCKVLFGYSNQFENCSLMKKHTLFVKLAIIHHDRHVCPATV